MSADIPQVAPSAEMQNWKAPTPGTSANVLGINAPELNTKSAAEQLGLTDGAFKVKRGKGENAYVDTGWIVKRTDVDFDPDTKTNRMVVVLEDTKVDASDPNIPSSKTMWADDLLRMQEPESENAAEVAKAEEVIEDVGGVAIHSEVTVDTSETDQQVSATEEQNTSEASTADTTEQNGEEAKSESETVIDSDVDVDTKSPEQETANELPALKVAKEMLGNLANDFAPVDIAVKQLASATSEGVSAFTARQKKLLDGVGQSVNAVKGMTGNVTELTRFVYDLQNNMSGEIGAKEIQSVRNLMEAVTTMATGMSIVIEKASAARRGGNAAQIELAEALSSMMKRLNVGIEGFKASPVRIKEKALEADHERSIKKEKDQDYTKQQQDADNNAIEGVYLSSSSVVQKSEQLSDDANVARVAIQNALDSGTLTADLLKSSRLGPDAVVQIRDILTAVANKLSYATTMRGSRGMMHAELRPLINGSLAPVIEKIKMLQQPDVSLSDQPTKLNKIGAAVKGLQQSAGSTQGIVEGLRK